MNMDTDMAEAVWIGGKRELLWDDHLIDTERTTAQLRLHGPTPGEVVLRHDAPWEGDGCDFHNIVKEDGFYRMYYLGWSMFDADGVSASKLPIVVCYAESEDGLHWVKPNLGICEFDGSTDNNIILDQHTARFDNFSVFKDTNPACPAEERYKGVGIDGFKAGSDDHYLWCFTSADGIHFTKAWRMTNRGKFDTLNVAFWDRHTGRYKCYLRDFHDVPGEDLNAGIRDVRVMESADFKQWTVPVRLDFGGGDDYPLYTNVVQPYYRADHMYVGFPSRYVEKPAWTPNFEQLAGKESRLKRMKQHPRYGLTVTDGLFMSSRDGARWNRWDEAFLTPGPEREINWVYGDCYPALGMIETPSALPHAPNELSLYTFDGHWSNRPSELRRYTIRIDGFVSFRATYKPQLMATKPFVFAGSRLSINFATSAAGFVRIRLIGVDGGPVLESGELFGDSLARDVSFDGGELAALAGRPVRMEATMSDADWYSFQFHD
ncbi:hypothetical protein [Paenibacillus cymbidii]|uniref:hypothetical protein n=1 Tax=Paenibacillus cymbidii TaxID=1639034 RepID=UPI00108073F6|nr:hypothetical protein [Paenibacillus cymbidii]